MRVKHRFEIRTHYHNDTPLQCLSPKMHQTSNPNGYGSVRVTPIACGLEAPKRHGKKGFFIQLHPSYSSIHNYQQ